MANTECDIFLRYQALAAIGNAATSTSVASIHNLVSSSKQQMQSSGSVLLPFKRAGAGIEIPPLRSLISSTSKCIPSTNIHKNHFMPVTGRAYHLKISLIRYDLIM